MKRLLIKFNIVLFAFAPLANAQTIPVTENFDHLSGVTAAHRDSLDAWESGDVVFRFRDTGNGRLFDIANNSFVEGPNAMSATIEQVTVYRFSFEFSKGNYRFITRHEQEINFFDALDNVAREPKRAGSESGFIQDKANGVRLNRYNGKLYEMNRDVEAEELSLQAVPGLKLIGLGRSSNDWSKDNLDRLLGSYRERDRVDEITNIGRGVYRFKLGANSPTYRWEVDWDIEKMVPIRSVTYKKPTTKHPEQRLVVENCQWQKRGQLNVPYKSRGKRMEWLREEGLYYVVDYETEFDAHWFSFNEELPPETFDPEQLRSVTALNELLSEKPLEDDSKKDSADSPSR